jgi:putative hydrolase of the HAD superfamily
MTARQKALTAIGFDADDTLWRHEHYYRQTEDRLLALLADHGAPHDISLRLLEIERRNLPLYGFGVKGFTLSMIETAIETTQGRVSAEMIAEVLAAGRELLRHPIEVLPHARDTLARLADDFRLILITKGDLFDQERKLEESGLADFFDAVEIVSDKSAATYARAFARHADGARARHDGRQFLEIRCHPSDRSGRLGRSRAQRADLGGRTRRAASLGPAF